LDNSIAEGVNKLQVVKLNEGENLGISNAVQNKKEDAKNDAVGFVKDKVKDGDDYVGATNTLNAAKDFRDDVRDSLKSTRSIISIIEPSYIGKGNFQDMNLSTSDSKEKDNTKYYSSNIYVEGCVSYDELKGKNKEEENNEVPEQEEGEKPANHVGGVAQSGQKAFHDLINEDSSDLKDESNIISRVEEAKEGIKKAIPPVKQELFIDIFGFKKDPAVNRLIQEIDSFLSQLPNVMQYDVPTKELFDNFCDFKEIEKKDYLSRFRNIKKDE
jgi:hypothetical protein